MRASASYPADVRVDLAAVVSALAGGERRTTLQLSLDLRLPLARVRGALQLLRAAGVLEFTTRWYGRNEGYARVWTFAGGGTVHLWEPVDVGRRRRLYAGRGEAVEAARRSMGPAADARAVVVLVGERGAVGP